MQARIRTLANQFFPEVVHLRRTIHANPELAFEEYETAHLVAETLAPLNLTVQTGVAQTGIMATLQGGQPGPTLTLRADMDALPIQEANTFDFASKNAGKMHACGHDAHTASLLGTAMILNEIKDDVHGQIRFIFQPSEEKIPGGAKVMMEEGVLADQPESPRPTTIFGQHVQPGMDAGKLGVRSGRYMASVDEVHITVCGQGGHAAGPHVLSADPVWVAAQTITALQSIISRNCPPDVPSVLSFGRFIADGATNIIPDEVQLAGTFRAMDEAWRAKAKTLIPRVVTHTAAALGATAEVNIIDGYPSLHNDPDLAMFVRERAVEYVGEANVVDLDLWFASEDFAWYLQEIPGVFYRLGVHNEAVGATHGLHTPRFTIDEEALRLGPGFMAYLAWHHGQSANLK